MAVALLFSIVMVIIGKELFKTSCVDSSLVWGCCFFFFGIRSFKGLPLFFILINFASGTESKPITW